MARAVVVDPGRRAHGSRPRTVRLAHARSRASTLVPQLGRQRLRRALANRISGVHQYRRIPTSSHGAPPPRVRPRRTRRFAVRELHDFEGELPTQVAARCDGSNRTTTLARSADGYYEPGGGSEAHALEDSRVQAVLSPAHSSADIGGRISCSGYCHF